MLERTATNFYSVRQRRPLENPSMYKEPGESVGECVRVRVRVCGCVCVRVRGRESEKERKRERVNKIWRKERRNK